MILDAKKLGRDNPLVKPVLNGDNAEPSKPC